MMLSVMADISLPVWAGRKQDRMLDEARAMARKDAEERRGLAAETRGAVHAAWERWDEAARLEVLYHRELLPQARAALAGMDLRLTVLPPSRQDLAKAEYVKNIGAMRAVAIGNGRNDRDMLAIAALGIVVVGPEGAAADTLTAADVVAPDILTALDLLTNPQRLVATLRC